MRAPTRLDRRDVNTLARESQRLLQIDVARASVCAVSRIHHAIPWHERPPRSWSAP